MYDEAMQRLDALALSAKKSVRRPWLAFLICVFFIVFIVAARGPASQVWPSKPHYHPEVATMLTTVPSITTGNAPTRVQLNHQPPPPPPIMVARTKGCLPPLLPSIMQPSMPAGVSDATCHARLNTDYMGERAPVWGLGNPGFHLRDAGECCAACQAHGSVCGKPGSQHKSWWPSRPELKCGSNPGCNIWVFCPEEQCFAFDIHVHKRGECWLKQQSKNITRPKDPHEGHTTFPLSMRRSPRSTWPWAIDKSIWPGEIPESVPWISGVIARAEANIVSAPADDRWRKRWCDKYGSTYGACDT